MKKFLDYSGKTLGYLVGTIATGIGFLLLTAAFLGALALVEWLGGLVF